MEGAQENDQKPLDKSVETGESNESSKLSSEVGRPENTKVFDNMESANNDSENVNVSPMCVEKENALPSEESTFASNAQQETSERGENSSFEASLSAEMDANAEGIPIGGGDLSESECVTSDELDSEKNCLNNSVVEHSEVLSGNDNTSDFHVKERAEQNEEQSESNTQCVDKVETGASDVHSVDDVDPLASDATVDNPNELQKESSIDGYCPEDSVHDFPKIVVSGSEIPECSESDSEAVSAHTVMNTDDVSVPAVIDCERTVIQNDLKNDNEIEGDEVNHDDREMDIEESAVSENTVKESATVSESTVDPIKTSEICLEAETEEESDQGIEHESLIESENNVQTEIHEECNEMECDYSGRESTVVVSPVSKSGVDEMEVDENTLANDDENSNKNISVTHAVSEASDCANMEINESEQPEKDPNSDTNKEDEEMLSEDDDLQVQKDSEKESDSYINNEDEEMLLSGETEIDTLKSSEMAPQSNEMLMVEEAQIDVQKSSEKENEEISVPESEENVGENDKIHLDAQSEENENHSTREENTEEIDDEGLEGSSEKSREKICEETSVSKEVDSEENSHDMQENVEFVQIDSDKDDENSQQSVDITIDEPIVIEKDPIALTNEESKEDEDVIIEENTNNQQTTGVDDASEIEKDNGLVAEKTADSEEPESVDISEMCETVLEVANSSVFKNNASSALETYKKRKLVRTVVAEVIDIEEVEDSEINKSRPETSVNKSVEDGKGKKKANVVSHQLSSGNDISCLDDEEICIIPDTVPKVITGKEEKGRMEALKAKRINKSTEGMEKGLEKTPEAKKDTSESRRTPGRPQRQAAKRAESQIKEIAAIDEEIQETEERTAGYRVCDSCFKVRIWVTSFKFQENGTEKNKYFCSQECASNFKKTSRTKLTDGNANSTGAEKVKRFTRKCAQCSLIISGDEKNLSWETMDYCNEECLGRYQKVLGSQCANCKGTVASASLGKYCVRFGYDVKQFCCSGCLEEFKKGLKNCSYCQKDISSGAEGFLAPVGDKGQFKDFCTQLCMEKYDQMSNNHAPPVVVQVCAVCNNEKVVSMEVIHKNRLNKFCSEPCFAAFRFVNGMMADQCYMCKKYFDKKEIENFSVYSDDSVHNFCSKTCMNVYILGNRKIVACHWCKVKKYNFDMIKRVFDSGQLLLVCSLNCLQLYQSGVNTASAKRLKCDSCGIMNPPQYNLNMSDNTVRSFCCYPCVMKFQEKYTNSVIVNTSPYPTGGPKRYVGPRRSLPVQQNEAQRENIQSSKTTGSNAMPVISSVQSLASEDVPAQNDIGTTTARSSTALKQVNNNIPQNASQSQKIIRQVIIRPPVPKQMRNKAATCRPVMHTKGTHCQPIIRSKESQTENIPVGKPVLIPIPVPIYVPTPMCMYSTSFPVPVPFPLPVPVPIFIPTTRNSAKGIMKEIKRIQEKIPSDPFEAEILMMAEIVANQKKEENCDSDSDVVDNVDAASVADADADVDEETKATTGADGSYTPENVDSSNTFGEDMLQMALLKMATELEEPADLEAALTPTTITTQPSASVEHTNSESEDDPEPLQPAPEPRPQRGKKRPVRSVRSHVSPTVNKRRRISASGEPPHLPPPEPPQPTPVLEIEKPDANMCLKYTLGVNAWKRWVLTKNAELEKAAANNRKLKLFKTEILQQTADELNYSLCLFVKEVRKPNGHEYAPDTIYYLCLGIQQYLFESGRIDNIFTDPYYEKFTECLDEVAKKFSSLYNDSQYIVTRVEEEHLWESKQLGAHSPHVLLSTLMFFNTKHFNLTTVEEHMQLSFSHIMKHWKRNPSQSGGGKGGTNSSRNVLLRFYPPQSALEGNSKKKKVYEQQENEENPLRCPVKLYEFYLSKCPESVKTRNDVFYLLPERSCVPDSPVWYSTMALGKEPLMKMLHRVKMVKEINQALLKS